MAEQLERWTLNSQSNNPGFESCSGHLLDFSQCHTKFKSLALLVESQQGSVGRRTIRANLRLNFIWGFFFFYWKAFSRIIFSILL